MRKFLCILGLVIGAPLLAGLIYQPLATTVEARRFPAPGRLIAVNGHRLHIRCEGSGYPTVVLEAGLGGSSLDWSLVAPALARQTRVCTYDRAGYGWSEPGPLPRTSAAAADELHRLLIRAEEPGPYIIAAHGLGGLHARLFADRYPQETAGLVMVAPIDDEPDSPELNQTLMALSATGLHRALAAAHALPESLGGLTEKLPADLQPAHRAVNASSRFFTALRQESEALEASLEQAHQAQVPTDLPLVTVRPAPGESAYLHIDRPEAVVTAISGVVEAARLSR